MKNKVPALLTIALMIVVSLVSGCSRVYPEPPILPLARAIPHSIDFKFTNCNTCHVAGELGTVTPHLEYTNDSCSQAGCHATPRVTTISITTNKPNPSAPGATVTLTAKVKPALTTAGIPTGKVTFFVDGTSVGEAILSGGYATLTTSAFVDGDNSVTAQYSGDDAFDASQSTAVKHTVVDTSTITTTTTTTPPDGTTTTPGGNTLTMAALPLKPEFHPAAYDTLCMLCHAEGVGVQQYPLPPIWPGTPVTPGPWTIVPGSDQDHTGRTDVSVCTTQSGCHTVTR